MLRKILLTVVVLEIFGLLFFSYSAAHTSPFEEAQRITSVCQNASVDQVTHEKCIAHEFADLGEKRGIEFMGDMLGAYQGMNSGYRSYQNCHVLSHRIMNDLGARNPEGWKDLISRMSAGELDPTRCGGGFLHGVLEVRAAADPTFTVNADLFHEICTESLPQGVATSCAHILGHLALVESLGVLNEALKACDGLNEDFLFQCYGGIFMEDSMRTNLEVHGLASLPERNQAWLTTQQNRCDRYKENPEIVSGCWYDLPEVFAQTHQYDLVQTYNFCAKAPTKKAHDSCYTRASYLIALAPTELFKSFPYQELCALYKSGTPELSRCMQDVVGAPLTGSMQLLDRTVSFCEARPAKAQGECFSYIVGQINRHSAGNALQQQSLCLKIPESQRPLCLKTS